MADAEKCFRQKCPSESTGMIANAVRSGGVGPKRTHVISVLMINVEAVSNLARGMINVRR